MVGRPGKLQSSFTAGELDPLMHERTELKYHGQGLAIAENIEVAPQGGFFVRKGLRDIGAAPADAARLFPFDASNGNVYELAFRPEEFGVWGEAGLLDTVAIAGLTAPMLPQMVASQQLDTMLVFHQDFESGRIKHAGPTSWSVDKVPFENLPLYDYGASYSNGVAAEWQIEFVGLTNGTTVFTLTVSGNDTLAITYSSTMATLAASVEAAILNLPNVGAGVTVADGGGTKLDITFDGADNLGDGWAVTGKVVNKTDAAIVSHKTVVGVTPGEEIISTDRGWPACGTFYQQRLAVGGFKSLPGHWMFGISGDYYNFDERVTDANGPAVIAMAVAGGETIVNIVDNRYLLIFTSRAEYWIAERALSRTSPPNHVQASTHGSQLGVPVALNEGAALFTHKNASVLGEFRYTDVEGNFVATSLSLLASHLVVDVRDQAVRTATLSTDGNQLGVVKADGSALLATLVREQEVTAFTRHTSKDGLFKAVCRNGRNELAWLVQRPGGRRLERSEEGLLLDEAQSFDFTGSPQSIVTGLGRFDAREVWAIVDGNVFGPLTCAAGAVELPLAGTLVTIGTWMPPVVQILPLDRTIGPNLVLKRKARIHSVTLSLLDTTSVALGVNGRRLEDQDLRRYGMQADVAELEAGFTGEISIRGLSGWVDEPYVTVSQVRPGRLTVRSINVQAQL